MNMEALYDWGLRVIKYLQGFQSPVLTFIMEFISFFSDPFFYFGLVIILYWCLDSSTGYKLSLAVVFSGVFNTAIKEVLQVHRPFIRDPSVFIIGEYGYSTPSGHSQGSATFYPLFARYVMGPKNGESCKIGKNCNKKKISFCTIIRLSVALILPLLIGFTRIYLGVHYPTDVALGLILGFLTSLGIILFWQPCVRVISTWRPSLQMLLAAVVVLVLNYFSGPRTSLSGALFGFLIGRIMWAKGKHFWDTSGTIKQRLLRLPLGLILTGVVLLVFEFLKDITNQELPTMDLVNLIRFIQFTCAGITVIYLCPLLFIRFGIAMPAGGESES